MRLEKANKSAEAYETEFECLNEEVNELKYRLHEDEAMFDFLEESEEESDFQKKWKEMKKHLADAAKLMEKAEHILSEVIRAREKENLNIEDAILLTDGTTKVREKKTKTETV